MTDDKDKRQKQISLTEDGKAYALRVLEPFFKLNESVAEQLGNALFKQIVENLNALGNAIETEITKQCSERSSS